MASITIKNVGPVKHIENLEINAVNVFMGPQGCGKSTVAKIISFCTWMEKRVGMKGSLREFLSQKTGKWIEDLKSYHRLLNGYFSADSAILYKGDYITYAFNCEPMPSGETTVKNENEIIDFHTDVNFQNSKVMYIPAERNFVTVIPNLHKYVENRDSIQDFIGSWYEAKRTFEADDKLSLLESGIKYHSGNDDLDWLTLENGQRISLQTASSGFQSLTPLLGLFDYTVIGLYGKSRPMSVQETDALLKEYNELRQAKKEKREEVDSNALERLYDMIISKNYAKSQIVIEEPEQNLFPTTQRDLVYHLLKSLNLGRGDRLTLTTHSPYILYALNNCMMGYLVDSQLQGEEKAEYLASSLPSEQSWIDPKKVSVWEFENGGLRNIQDKDQIISENYFDKIMTDLTDEFYHALNYYKDEEQDN
ncbi:MAG: AAA family ATPase [Tannerella sp.]|nr:AAA family ATPase [Tannerella sp.]